MPVKDRLPELQKLQELKSEENGSGGDESKKTEQIEKVYKQVELISRLISNVAENSKICEEILQGKKVQRQKEQQNSLVSTFKESESLSLKISTQLKQMRTELKKQNKSNAESRMFQIQYNSLTTRFNNVLQEHQNCVQKHRDSRKELLAKSAKIVKNEHLDPGELEELIEGGEKALFTQDYLLQEREARQQLTDVENRHKELLAIESHLIEIKDLFVQMAILIEQQQESVNRIEFQAMSAAEYVDNTVDQLQQAEQSQGKKRKMCLYIWIAISVALMFMIIGMLI